MEQQQQPATAASAPSPSAAGDQPTEAEDYEIECIVDHRPRVIGRVRQRDSAGFVIMEYRAHWLDYSMDEDTWEPREHFSDLTLACFHDTLSKLRIFNLQLKARFDSIRYPYGRPRRQIRRGRAASNCKAPHVGDASMNTARSQ